MEARALLVLITLFIYNADYDEWSSSSSANESEYGCYECGEIENDGRFDLNVNFRTTNHFDFTYMW